MLACLRGNGVPSILINSLPSLLARKLMTECHRILVTSPQAKPQVMCSENWWLSSAKCSIICIKIKGIRS